MIKEKDDDPEDAPDSIPDWLGQIQREYQSLMALREKEKGHSHKISLLIALLQEEVGGPVPISRNAFAGSMMDVRSAFLMPDAALLLVDGAGNKNTVPLVHMPPDTVLAVAKESVLELKRQIMDKRRQLAKKANALEKVAADLERVHLGAEPLVEPASTSEPAPAPEKKAEVEVPTPSVESTATTPQEEAKPVEVVASAAPDQTAELKKDDEVQFAFTASYQEHRKSMNSRKPVP